MLLGFLAFAVLQPPILQDAATIYKKSSSAVVKIETDSAIGTGFAIDDGTLIVTCNHVVGTDYIVTIRCSKVIKGFVLFRDKSRDIAIVKTYSAVPSRLALKPGGTPSPGSKVYVVGNPLGFLDRTITEGIVGGIRQVGAVRYIQFSAPISEGSSGSPVLDSTGRVVGMAKATFKEGQNNNIAVVASDVRESLSNAKRIFAGLVPTRKIGDGVKVIGKLGQAKEVTPIYASMSRDSKIYYYVKQFEYLVVTAAPKKNWVRILLQNGEYGYVPSFLVVRLPYEVTAKFPLYSNAQVSNPPKEVVTDAPPQYFEGVELSFGDGGVVMVDSATAASGLRKGLRITKWQTPSGLSDFEVRSLADFKIALNMYPAKKLRVFVTDPSPNAEPFERIGYWVYLTPKT